MEAPPCGTDCDDGDAERQDARECSALCDDNPEALGCRCADETAELECYTAPAETLGVGECHAGVRRCEGGRWTTCLDEVRPGFEICNLADDDCDGFTDDGTAFDACGACADGTSCQCYGPRAPCSAWGEVMEGLTDGKGGVLKLAGGGDGDWRAQRACEGESAQWLSVTLDADLPPGTSLDVWARSAPEADWLGDWIALGAALEDGQSFGLEALANEASFQASLVLELRVVMHAAPGGESPALREVRLDFQCFEAPGP